jgi:predicted nucleic-acid-binding Zn-ribbon protein
MLIKAELKIKQDYRCSKCGITERGDTETHDVPILFTSADLKEFIDKLPKRAAYMPVYWANSYTTGFNCPKCKEYSQIGVRKQEEQHYDATQQ